MEQRRQFRSFKRSRGASAAELLVALPSLLMLGLGALQLALWFHARSALNHAVFEAARAGAAANADPSAMDKAFARGITPWLYGADNIADMEVGVLKAQLHVVLAKTLGWYELRLLSPSAESFDDWAVPARDSLGKEIAGVVEIPNDNLRTLAILQEPVGGSSVIHQGAYVGSKSKQTLVDANTLKIVGHYGIPLNVPLVGPLIAATMRMMEGCALPSVQVLGATRMQAPLSVNAPSAVKCANYWGIGENGVKGTPRLPVELSATVRMQSAARKSGLTESVTGQGSALAALGPGIVDLPALSPDQPVKATSVRNRPEWEQQLPDMASKQPRALGEMEEPSVASVPPGNTASTPPQTVVVGSVPPGASEPSAGAAVTGGVTSPPSNTPQQGGLVDCPS